MKSAAPFVLAKLLSTTERERKFLHRYGQALSIAKSHEYDMPLWHKRAYGRKVSVSLAARASCMRAIYEKPQLVLAAVLTIALTAGIHLFRFALNTMRSYGL